MNFSEWGFTGTAASKARLKGLMFNEQLSAAGDAVADACDEFFSGGLEGAGLTATARTYAADPGGQPLRARGRPVPRRRVPAADQAVHARDRTRPDTGARVAHPDYLRSSHGAFPDFSFQPLPALDNPTKQPFPDVASPLGPLAGLVGSWSGRGFNVIWRPDQHARIKTTSSSST